LIPGSHRWIDDSETDEAKTIQALMPAGSVMFYVGSLVHGGGSNRTEQPRLGVILEFIVSWLKPQENHLIGIPRDTVRELPQRLQELLGWNVMPPFIGYVDGRHPRKYLDRSP
jgi:ectoine hydroxylase-related dioxygenase (phytanoyl-CoA dioxygenase family)